jgi:hypothetical protein
MIPHTMSVDGFRAEFEQLSIRPGEVSSGRGEGSRGISSISNSR